MGLYLEEAPNIDMVKCSSGAKGVLIAKHPTGQRGFTLICPLSARLVPRFTQCFRLHAEECMLERVASMERQKFRISA